MPSSTSSSRGIFFKVLLAATLVMGLSMGIVRLTTYLSNASGGKILARVLEARNCLPQIIAERQDLMMFFGSSMVEAAFAPIQFDNELAEKDIELKSFNFGFGGLNPFFQDYLSRRIKESFLAKDRRLKLALIEFTPFQATVTRRLRALPLEDSFLTMLASDQELFDLLLRDPKRGIRVYNIRYLRDSISAEMITHHLGSGLLPKQHSPSPKEGRSNIKKLRAFSRKRRELLKKEYPDFLYSYWYYPWQGGKTLPMGQQEIRDLYRASYSLTSNPYYLEKDRLRRIRTADIIDLNFDEVLVDAFIRIVENFKEISDQVEVVLLPRNTAWIVHSSAAQARLQAVLQKIEDSTGVEVKDYQALPEFTPDLFSDTTHLSRYKGDVAFTHFLAEEYAKVIHLTATTQ